MKRLTALTFGIFLAFLAGAQVTTSPTVTGVGTNLATMVTGTLSPANGGTGVANNAAATLTRSGNHALTVTTSGTANLSIGTGGTLGTAAYTAATNYATSAQGTTADNAMPKAGGTFTGSVASTYFGDNVWAATGTGDMSFTLRNSSAGTGNRTILNIGNDTSSSMSRIMQMSSNFSTSSYQIADTFVFDTGGAGGFAFAANHASGNVKFYTGGAGTPQLTITAAGGLLVPSLATSSAPTTGTMCWTTGTGNVDVDTTTTCLLSSKKYKQDGYSFSDGLDVVMRLKPVAYHLRPQYDTGIGEQIGLYAEDVAKVEPRLVSLERDGSPRAVRYQQLTAVLVKAVQEQQAQIEELRAAVDLLTNGSGRDKLLVKSGRTMH